MLSKEEVQERLAKQYSQKRVDKVLGNGKKTLAQAEQPFYHTTNRSVVARRDMDAGERLDEENCALLRSEQNRSPGLRPAEWPAVHGAKLVKPVTGGEGVSWTHLLQ